MERVSIYEAAGGEPAFAALAAAHHARCLADPVLEHPFSHGINPDARGAPRRLLGGGSRRAADVLGEVRRPLRGDAHPRRQGDGGGPGRAVRRLLRRRRGRRRPPRRARVACGAPVVHGVGHGLDVCVQRSTTPSCRPGWPCPGGGGRASSRARFRRAPELTVDGQGASPGRAGRPRRPLALAREFCRLRQHAFDPDRVLVGLRPLLADDTLGQVWLVDDPEHPGERAGYAVLTWGWSVAAGGRECLLDELHVRARGNELATRVLAVAPRRSPGRRRRESADRDRGARPQGARVLRRRRLRPHRLGVHEAFRCRAEL